MRGKFITLEGIEGSGKSTSLDTISKILETLDIEFIITKEPGGGPLGKDLRKILLDKKTSISPEVELLLMMADRKNHIDNIVEPCLEKGVWVISDRYLDSSYAYQGGGRGIDIDWLIRLNEFATYGIEPDLTFYIDIDPKVGFQRREDLASDRIENAGLEFQRDIRKKYLEIVNNFSDRIVKVDGNLSVEDISKFILNIIIDRTSVE